MQEWRAYHAVEPFGDDWQQTGTMAAAALNPHSKKSLKPTDFIPSYKPKQTQADMQTALMQLAEQVSTNG